MQGGRLRQRITIEDKIETRDSAAGRVEQWYPVREVWAQVMMTSAAREGYVPSADQELSTATYLVRIRYASDITDQMRIQHQGRALDILSVVDPDGRQRELRLMCEAMADGGV